MAVDFRSLAIGFVGGVVTNMVEKGDIPQLQAPSYLFSWLKDYDIVPTKQELEEIGKFAAYMEKVTDEKNPTY